MSKWLCSTVLTTYVSLCTVIHLAAIISTMLQPRWSPAQPGSSQLPTHWPPYKPFGICNFLPAFSLTWVVGSWQKFMMRFLLKDTQSSLMHQKLPGLLLLINVVTWHYILQLHRLVMEIPVPITIVNQGLQYPCLVQMTYWSTKYHVLLIVSYVPDFKMSQNSMSWHIIYLPKQTKLKKGSYNRKKN